jgi:hypothetical protein
MSVIPRARALGLIVVIALTGALAGCYSAASSSDYVVSSGSTSWSVPSAWRMTSTPPLWSGGLDGITFVSPDDIAGHCLMQSGHLATLEGCWPIATLPQNGALVASIPLHSPTPQPAASLWATIHASGGAFPVFREGPGPRGAIGASETLVGFAPGGGDQAGAVAMPGAEKMPACVRGPDLAAGEASATGILVSVRLRDRLTDRGDQPHMPHNPPLTDPAATPTVEVNQRAVCRIW